MYFPAARIFAVFALLPLNLGFSGPAGAAALPVFHVDIAEGVYTPQNIEAPAGQRFKILLKNSGKSPAEFENLALRVEKVLAADGESFVVIHPLKPGSYHFIDEFHLDKAGFDIFVKAP